MEFVRRYIVLLVSDSNLVLSYHVLTLYICINKLVGKQNYLTITHPDISFAVSMVSQFISAPRLLHWEVVIRIVKYPNAHPRCGLFY